MAIEVLTGAEGAFRTVTTVVRGKPFMGMNLPCEEGPLFLVDVTVPNAINSDHGLAKQLVV